MAQLIDLPVAADLCGGGDGRSDLDLWSLHGRELIRSLTCGDPLIVRLRKILLDMFIVEGVNTSIPLHQKILAHPDFQSGDIYTAFLEHMNEPRKNRGIA